MKILILLAEPALEWMTESKHFEWNVITVFFNFFFTKYVQNVHSTL